MRIAVLLLCLVALGCGLNTPKTALPGTAFKAAPPGSTTTDSRDLVKHVPPSPPELPAPAEVLVTPAVSDELTDLRTRKTGSDWPTFLGPTATSVSPEKGIVTPWPKEGLRFVWYTRMGAGYVMPAISMGRAFVFDRGLDGMRLRCLNSENGDLLWKFEYPSDYKDLYGYDSGPRATPVVDGNRVYIHGPEGMLHCVTAADGKLIWKVDTKAKFGVLQNFFGVGSAPVVEGDLLIVHVGGSSEDSPAISTGRATSNGTAVVAFDKHTGKVRYQVGDDLASYAAPVLATIDGRRWCFVLARGGLIGMDPKSGKIDFQYPWRAKTLESVNASNPVVVGDRVFISETYGPGSSLLKVKPGGYEVLWSDADKGRDKSMQCHWSTPIYHDGYLYGCSGRHDSNAELRCIELATGKVMWSERNLTRTSLLMIDGHFLCLGEDGQVLLLKVNPQKFDVVSRVEQLVHPTRRDKPVLLTDPCWAAPIVSHGLLYLRGKDYLVCLDLIPEKR